MRDRTELRDEIVVRDAQVVEQFTLFEVPDEQREGFLGFVATNENSIVRDNSD